MRKDLEWWIEHLTGANGMTLGASSAPLVLGFLRELAELRQLAAALDKGFSVWALWGDGEELPDQVGLSDSDGDAIDVALDASKFVVEVRRRQAKTWCDSVADGEGPPLEQLLALVPAELWLAVDCLANGRHVAWWRDRNERTLAHASGDTYQAAIRAATLKLSARLTCETCEHWRRDAHPSVTDGISKPCGLDRDGGLRRPDSSCPDRYRATVRSRWPELWDAAAGLTEALLPDALATVRGELAALSAVLWPDSDPLQLREPLADTDPAPGSDEQPGGEL